MTDNNVEQENSNQLILAVYELGSDNNAWFVRGTANVDIARGAVIHYVNENTTDTDEIVLAALDTVEAAQTETHENWFWVELDGNTMLQWLKDDEEASEFVESFPGVRFF